MTKIRLSLCFYFLLLVGLNAQVNYGETLFTPRVNITNHSGYYTWIDPFGVTQTFVNNATVSGTTGVAHLTLSNISGVITLSGSITAGDIVGGVPYAITSGTADFATNSGAVDITNVNSTTGVNLLTLPGFVGTPGSNVAVTGSANIVTITTGNLNTQIIDSGIVGVTPTTPLSITVSGTWIYPYPFLLRSGDNLQLSGSVYLTGTGLWIESFSYTESNWSGGLTSCTFNNLIGIIDSFVPTSMPSLTTLSFPALTVVGNAFNPTSTASITTISCPALKVVGGRFGLSLPSLTTCSFPELTEVGNFLFSLPACTTLNFPKLTTVADANGFSLSPMTSLTTLGFPELTTVAGGFSLNNMPSLTTLSFPKLTTVGNGFSLINMPSLTTVSFPKLTTLGILGGSFFITNMSALTTLSFPSMITYGVAISLTNLTNITSCVLGNIGTLKSINGSVTVSGMKLTQSSVDGILALIASLDGTNGTTSWGTGKTLNLNGGTNAAPSASGSTSKATIVARGGTVTTN